MKNTYTSPKLTQFGTVESLTQLFGTSTAADTGYLNGFPLITGHGSEDGIFVPCSLAPSGC